ncbi:hypothetical protein RhiirA4_471736 [Rhizophagus irregularis]|uniref:Uncharacterized protein n=1 Tax=Rhizophagus irregularis TaxID=588596 RepID=A0A2I1H3P9_9GLOM|nr:hypothetical protein RhiirA4_471736 [Rhizophagus irregularis]
MVTDQKHSSDISSEQEAIRYTEKLAQAFGLNEQNAEMYSTLSGENRSLKKQLEDYHSQHNSLERRVKRLERDVGSLKIKLQDLDEYVDRETVVDLIHEIVPTLINKKSRGSSYSSESSEESDSEKDSEAPSPKKRFGRKMHIVKNKNN